MRNKHLHPLALMLFIWRALIQLIYVLVGFMFLKTNVKWILLFAALLLITSAIVKYATFTYSILSDELVIKRGLFFKQERHVPYERIQAIQTRQWFFLKPFGIEEVVINNASTDADDSKVDLPAVNKQVATILEQRHRSATHQVNEAEVVENNVQSSNDYQQPNQYQIKAPDMFAFALTNLNIFAQLLLLFSLIDRLPINFTQEVNWAMHFTSNFYQGFGVLVTLIILLMIVSLGQTIIKYYHFTLSKRADHLVIEKGLFQRRLINIPINKIQAVEFKQTILRQLFHITTVQLHIITSSDSDDDKKVITIMPIVKADVAFKIIHQFIGLVPSQGIDFSRGDYKSQWLFVRNGCLVSLALMGGISIFYQATWLWFVYGLVLLYIIINGLYKGRVTGAAQISTDRLALRTAQQLTKKTLVVNWHQIQSVNLRQSLWMVNSHRAHLKLAIRSGYVANTFEYRYLPTKQAQAIFDWYHEFKN